MPYQIEPLRPEDLPALGRFLAEGFGAPEGAQFTAVDVLRWKYLDPKPRLGEEPRSFIARDDDGRIVGHVGFFPTTWRQAGAEREMTTLHMTDWLGSRSERGVGAALMDRAHARTTTQYVVGGTGYAFRGLERGGYERLGPLPIFRRVLRPGHRLREVGPSPGRRWLPGHP